MKLFILILSILLSSCTQFIEHNTRVDFPANTNMKIEIRKLKGGNLNTLAYTEVYPNNSCIIYLRNYPQCLSHEVRHCYEGDWHKGRKTDEDCY